MGRLPGWGVFQLWPTAARGARILEEPREPRWRAGPCCAARALPHLSSLAWGRVRPAQACAAACAHAPGCSCSCIRTTMRAHAPACAGVWARHRRRHAHHPQDRGGRDGARQPAQAAVRDHRVRRDVRRAQWCAGHARCQARRPAALPAQHAGRRPACMRRPRGNPTLCKQCRRTSSWRARQPTRGSVVARTHAANPPAHACKCMPVLLRYALAPLPPAAAPFAVARGRRLDACAGRAPMHTRSLR